MPRFVTIHKAPGLSKEEVAANAKVVFEQKHAKFERNYINVFEGWIVTVYQADSKEALEREFERCGFPWDEIHEVQIASDLASLEKMASGGGGPPH